MTTRTEAPVIEEIPTLPDLLRPGLDLVFVGINPSERSGQRGHYYGHPGNAFWRRLSASPLVDRTVTPEDDVALFDLGIGFTDVVKRVVTDSSQVTRAELQASLPAFRDRIAAAAPRAICFTATRSFEALYPRSWTSGNWGRQDVEPLAGATIWVMPSPSGLASGHHHEIDRVLSELAQSLGWDRRSTQPRPGTPNQTPVDGATSVEVRKIEAAR